MDTYWNCPKKWENKRVYALRGGWTITGIAKKVQNEEGAKCIKGACIKGQVDND